MNSKKHVVVADASQSSQTLISDILGDAYSYAYALGAADYILRPFSAAALRFRVENTLILYNKQRQLRRSYFGCRQGNVQAQTNRAFERISAKKPRIDFVLGFYFRLIALRRFHRLCKRSEVIIHRDAIHLIRFGIDRYQKVIRPTRRKIRHAAVLLAERMEVAMNKTFVVIGKIKGDVGIDPMAQI